MSSDSALGTVMKAVGTIVLLIIGIVGLSVAWIQFVFSADASPGHELGEKVSAAIIALVTVGVVGAGLYFLFRDRPTEAENQISSTCAECGRAFPSSFLQAVESRGNICADCTTKPNT